MKKILLSVFFAGAAMFSNAQFVNLDFEGAVTSSALLGPQPSGWLSLFGTEVTTGQHQGTRSWTITTTTNATIAGLLGWPSNDVPGILEQSATGTLTIPTSIDLYVKYSPVSGDTAGIGVYYTDTLATGAADDVTTDGGYVYFPAAVNNWTAVNIPVVNIASGVADEVVFQFLSSSGGEDTQDHPGSALSVDAIVFNFPTGVSETFNGEIKPVLVYPNPAQNMVNFHAGGEAAYVEIMDLTGKVVLASALNTGVNQFNVAELSNGSYIYTVKNVNNEVLMTEKLIIAH